LAKVTRDSPKITAEQVHGLMSQVILDVCLDLFIALCFYILLIHYNAFSGYKGHTLQLRAAVKQGQHRWF
jgi:hypothetical protein